MKCLVTGASGFIGRHLCQHLDSQGLEVLPLSLHGAPLPDGTPTYAIDLTQGCPVDLLADVDVVIHLAGIAHRRATAGDYELLNVEATRALAGAAAAAGVGRFIYVSSVKAMGYTQGGGRRNEDDGALPDDAYGLSKLNAERALLALAEETAMTVVILRPTLVYGVGAKGNLSLLARWARLGLPRPPVGGMRSMIAVADFSALITWIAASRLQGVHTWIAGGQDYSAQDIYDALRRASGAGVGVSWAPRWLWRLAAAVYDAVGPGASTFEKLFGTELYDHSRVMEQTDWRPQHRFEDCAAQMLGDGE